METKFTKGEWVIEDLHEYYKPSCSGIEIHSEKSSGWICKVQTDGVIQYEEGLANAKLIAAAPDMLEALKMVGMLNLQQYDEGTIGNRVHKYVQSAIKKATE